jgi:hypothetical protein
VYNNYIFYLFCDAAATASSLAECLNVVLLRVVLSGRGDGGRESPRTGVNALDLEEEEKVLEALRKEQSANLKRMSHSFFQNVI